MEGLGTRLRDWFEWERVGPYNSTPSRQPEMEYVNVYLRTNIAAIYAIWNLVGEPIDSLLESLAIWATRCMVGKKGGPTKEGAISGGPWSEYRSFTMLLEDDHSFLEVAYSEVWWSKSRPGFQSTRPRSLGFISVCCTCPYCFSWYSNNGNKQKKKKRHCMLNYRSCIVEVVNSP